jgi:hypothetical protein
MVIAFQAMKIAGAPIPGAQDRKSSQAGRQRSREAGRYGGRSRESEKRGSKETGKQGE